MKIKIIAAILLASGAIFFSGCGYEKVRESKPAPQAAPVQETRPSENTERVERKTEVGEPLNTSIEVTKDEMDRFINVAKNYQLTEGEVRKLVQIFKQIGMNFDPQLRISINPITEEKLVSAMRPLEYKTLGYSVECQASGTKPQLIVDGTPRNARGWYILTYGQDDSGKDFEVYFKFMFGEAVCPMYQNHRIIDTVETLSCTVTDETFNKMHNIIMDKASSKGKFVEIQNGGVTALKNMASLTYVNNAPCIIVFPDVIVESNVYGEGKKKFYSDFQFGLDGSLVKFKLWESKDKVN